MPRRRSTASTRNGSATRSRVDTCLSSCPRWPSGAATTLFAAPTRAARSSTARPSRLAAIEELLNAERAAIGTVAATTLRGGAKKLCEHGLAALYAFELEVQKASQAKDAANKALKKGMAAREAAVADERKAAAIKDDSKRAVAKAAAQRALEKADHEKGEAEDAFARAEQELGRLNREAQPAALRAATDARRQVESGPLMSAAAALAAAYQTFAEGAATALGGGDGAPRGEVKIVNSKMRKAPKEAGTSQFSGHVVQWTLAKRRGKASAALVEEFIKCGLETLLCPAKEGRSSQRFLRVRGRKPGGRSDASR